MGADKVLQRTCLKQHFSLRRQLLTSFGSAAFVTLLLVVIISIIMLNRAGDLVKDRSSSVMRDQIHSSLVDTTISTAEMFSKFQENYDGVVMQIAQIVSDRIVNYPRVGWEKDEFVPFVDIESQRNVYPLNEKPVIFDWQVVPDITAENIGNVVPGREHWLEAASKLATYQTGVFNVQGTCDPNSPPGTITYYPDCTDANNNMTTGGVVKPTSTAKGLYDKSGDLSVLFRPIYETSTDIFTMGAYFFNSGAGASVVYPGALRNGLSLSYISTGCDYLREENLRTQRPFASEEEIARCHPKGQQVRGRDYNAAERDWFRQAVEHNGEVVWVGPYKAAGFPISLMTVAKAIFDSRSGELIGVVNVDISIPDINRLLMQSRLYEHSEWAVLTYGEGWVLADSIHSETIAPPDHTNVTWQDEGILSDMSFRAMRDAYDRLFERSDWDNVSLAAAADAAVQPCPYGISAAYPLPIPPKRYEDNPDYFPFYLAVQVIAEAAYDPIEDFEDSIDNDVLTGSLVAATVGAVGMCVILVTLWCVARVITKPLLWMELVSWRIVNHGDKRSGDALRVQDEDDLTATVKFSPRTEITELVEEFRDMITGFSGEGSSRVAEPEPNEVRNTLTWQSDFRQLYTKASMKARSLRSGITNNTPSTEPDTNNSPSTEPDIVSGPSEHGENKGQDITKNVNNSGEPQNVGIHNPTTKADEKPEENNIETKSSEESRRTEPSSHLKGGRRVDGPGQDESSVDFGKDEPLKDEPLRSRREAPFINNGLKNEPFKPSSEIGEPQKVKLNCPPGSVSDTKGKYIITPAPPKRHLGPVAARLAEDRSSGPEEYKSRKPYRSRLFCWIVVLIVLPLLVTNVVITTIVTQHILNTVPSWVDDMRKESVELEIAAMTSIVESKAWQLSMILDEPVRDLFLITRVAGWLHFGAIQRANSFTEELAASEECKEYKSNTCPVYWTSPDYQCPCVWNDISVVGNCTDEPHHTDSRRMQKRFFGVLAQDFDPITGARTNAASYNDTAYSPNTTLWQKDVAQLPGAEKGDSASGFGTTYDRVRVTSALAVIDFPIYHYQEELHRSRQIIGSYLAFEADGLMTGYSGCSHIHTGFANFQSNDGNKAYEINEALCPKGKFGFDPRCRLWYSEAKEGFLDSRDMIHITAPYVFAFDGSVGLSAATPIGNAANGEFAGVMLHDFQQRILWDALESLSPLVLSYIIAPEVDIYGGDIVVGPNKSKCWEPALIVDELLPNDEDGSPEKAAFEENIRKPMQSGASGNGRYSRHDGNGNIEELVTVYAPVEQAVISPLDPSDFVHGLNVTHKAIYSFGISAFLHEMDQSFEEVEDSVNDDLDRLALIDSILVLFLSIVFLFIACKIAILVTKPMLTLLNAVRSINSRENKRDIPPLEGGSREVHQVYNSFSKLYKVVRISNTAFFSGNLVWANHIVNDALQLFRKIEDQKAIGIACNNLGNVLYARILELGKQSESSLNYGFSDCAMQHYQEAVAISQMYFDGAASIEEKASFARELSDRLFNRGLFLLFMVGEVDAPENARELGLGDIARARDLDYDVKEFYIENKLLLQYSDDCFTRILRRLHGLCKHYQDSEVRDLWDPSRLVDEADELLFAAWHEKSAPLFQDVSRVGRLQQLEGAAIRLETCKGNSAEAARIGMRMFTEDEYLMEMPFALSSASLLHFAQSEDNEWSSKTLTSMRSDLRKISRTCRSPTLDLGKCVVFALELNERLEGDEIFPMINSKCMNLYDYHCTKEDYVGMVAYTVNGDYTMELTSKIDNKEKQRTMLNNATTSTSERVCSALPFAMQVVLDCAVSQEMDTYILLFTDGYSWDSGPYLAIKNQLAEMNRENDSNVHLIVLGVDVEPEHVEECKAMCTISKGSFFIELTQENIDETFSFISSIFSTGRLYQQFLSTITMEKF